MKISQIDDPKKRARFQAALDAVSPPPLSFHELVEPSKAKRIRQSNAPTLNKLEAEFYEVLKREWDAERIICQKLRLTIANGCVFVPDFAVVAHQDEKKLWFYEVKGFMRDDAAVKLKVAAHQYPMFRFWLIWKKSGQWIEQEILP